MFSSEQISNVVEYPYRQMIEKTVGLHDLLAAREELSKIAAHMAIVDGTVTKLHQLALSACQALELARQAIGTASATTVPDAQQIFSTQNDIQAEGTQTW